MESAVPDVRRDTEYVFSAMVGMARCAVPARVVARGTNIRATLAFEGVAPLHAARTSQRDVPTTLNTYETRGYSRLSLRDSKAAVFPCGQNGPGVQQRDLWDKTSLRRGRRVHRLSVTPVPEVAERRSAKHQSDGCCSLSLGSGSSLAKAVALDLLGLLVRLAPPPVWSRDSERFSLSHSMCLARW